MEFLEVQEEYVKTELKNLKKEMLHAQEEIKRIQSVPLVIGQFLEAVDQNTGIVGSTTGTYFQKTLVSSFNEWLLWSGSNYYVRILSTIDRELLKTGASVALHKHSNALVDILPPESDSSISMLQAGTQSRDVFVYEWIEEIFLVDEKPDVDYSDIGGLDLQKQEIREAVELPLTHFGKWCNIEKILFWPILCKELYKLIGIDPPRGVLMYGPPGKREHWIKASLLSHGNIYRLW